jgi:hypothetical protein
MNTLLNKVLQAHGGLDNWKKVTSLDVNVSSRAACSR